MVDEDARRKIEQLEAQLAAAKAAAGRDIVAVEGGAVGASWRILDFVVLITGLATLIALSIVWSEFPDWMRHSSFYRCAFFGGGVLWDIALPIFFFTHRRRPVIVWRGRVGAVVFVSCLALVPLTLVVDSDITIPLAFQLVVEALCVLHWLIAPPLKSATASFVAPTVPPHSLAAAASFRAALLFDVAAALFVISLVGSTELDRSLAPQPLASIAALLALIAICALGHLPAWLLARRRRHAPTVALILAAIAIPAALAAGVLLVWASFLAILALKSEPAFVLWVPASGLFLASQVETIRAGFRAHQECKR